MLKKFENWSKYNKKILAVTIFITVLLVSSTLCLPVFGNVLPTGTIQTTAYMSLRPNPVGVNQQVLVNAWTVPNAPRWADLGLVPPSDPNDPHSIPGQSPTSGIPRLGYTYTITKPDGSVDKVVRTSDGPSSDWFEFYPDQVGLWTVEFSWDGVVLEYANGSQVTYTSCTTGKQQLVVQQERIPDYPVAELPTDFWSYPINSENREWYRISGPYLEPTTGTGRGYDGSGSRFNPYSRGPNTAHVLWKDPPASGMAGLIGGQYGQIAQYRAGAGIINIVMAGRAYYTVDNRIYCLDVRTGQRLWDVPGTYSFGIIEAASAAPATGSGSGLFNGQPTLVYAGNTLIKYDGITGAVKLNMTVQTGTVVYLGNDYSNVYLHYRPASTPQFSQTGPFYLIKLNMLGTTTNLTERLVYNKTYPFMAQDVGICIYGDVLTNIHYPEYGQSGGVNTTTGDVLWSRYINGIEQKVEAVTSANGVMYVSLNDRHFMAIDLKTGEELWVSEQTAYPWGNFWAYGQAAAYNTVYGLSYAGVYAFNAADGKINWHFAVPDSGMETPYSTIPFGSIDPIVADGKVYAPTSEHSPTLYYRGQHLYCLDATTGKEIWNIMGYYTPQAVAEDSLFATNAYDGNKYCFARGNTSTTVAVDDNKIALGGSVWITGTVMDMSPAQPNTPAVSKESMTAWMEYLHLQQPKPTDTKGVPVKLTATASDGNIIDIGYATSDADGIYRFKWTPSNQDCYKITASFEGDDSYYKSTATTVLSVGASTQASPAVTTTLSASPSAVPQAQAVPATELYIAIAAIIIITVVAAIAMLLHRRNK